MPSLFDYYPTIERSLANRLDWKATGKTLFYSLALGAVLYLIVATIRAPFVGIGHQHRQLLELDKRIVALTTQPQAGRILAESKQEALGEPVSRKVTKTVEIDPNIQPLEPEILIAHEQSDAIIVEGGIAGVMILSGEKGNFGVLALPFHNRIPEGKQIGMAHYVVARIVIRSCDRDTVQELNRVAWLSEESHRVFLGQGDTRKLIILVFEGRDDDPRVSAVRRDSGGTRKGSETQRLRLA